MPMNATVIYFAPEKSSRMMWLLLGMVLFLPVPYLYDTQPWFKFRFKVGRTDMYKSNVR